MIISHVRCEILRMCGNFATVSGFCTWQCLNTNQKNKISVAKKDECLEPRLTLEVGLCFCWMQHERAVGGGGGGNRE